MALPDHLVILAREPRLGAVKTRLARDIGPVAAWRFYEETLRGLLRETSGGPWTIWLGVTPDAATAHTTRRFPLAGVHVAVFAQGDTEPDSSLAGRMARPFQNLPPGPVVLVGSDIPDLRRRHIEQAFAALGRSDAVFGPAADGGYWLVGARRRPTMPNLFANVRWSTEFALADTLKNLRPKQTYALLETLEDVDDGMAWRRWRERSKSGRMRTTSLPNPPM